MVPSMALIREDVRRIAGRSIICGFEGPQVTAELRELVREARPLGLILFARNIESTAQLYELARELKALRPRDPLLLCVDQEGGRVARIPAPALRLPPMSTLGAIDDVELTRRAGRALGRELRVLGIDVNLAPVLDVHTRPENPVIGNRSFGSDPALVARHAVALIAGLHDAAVGACGKHFPGHGDTRTDSHLELPHLDHDTERLQRVEWPPFAHTIERGLEAVMSAHVVIDGLDPTLPATLSRAALAPLRDRLGFRGVILSDDIEMKALADHHRVDEIATLGTDAGIDVFLACRAPDVTLGLYAALVHTGEDGTVSHDALSEREQRIVHWYGGVAQPAASARDLAQTIGCTEHGALEREIEQRAQARVS